MTTYILPELRQIIGAMLFVRKEPVPVAEVLRVLKATAERVGGATEDYAAADEAMVQAVFEELAAEFAEAKLGFRLVEVAGGYHFENDVSCGPWLRVLLNKSKPTRLSIPALETLAIIAYRQPCVRSEIEAVRGVAVDSILKNLIELGLVRVTGRSELPGRPWMFGTTQRFMEHFGLKTLDDLPGTEELRRLEAEQKKSAKEAEAEGDPRQMTIEPLDPVVSAEEAVGESGDLFSGEGIPAEEAVEEIPDDAEAGEGEEI